MPFNIYNKIILIKWLHINELRRLLQELSRLRYFKGESSSYKHLIGEAGLGRGIKSAKAMKSPDSTDDQDQVLKSLMKE